MSDDIIERVIRVVREVGPMTPEKIARRMKRETTKIRPIVAQLIEQGAFWVASDRKVGIERRFITTPEEIARRIKEETKKVRTIVTRLMEQGGSRNASDRRVGIERRHKKRQK